MRKRKPFEQIAKEAEERFPPVAPVDDNTIMEFGKHKDKAMKDVPDEYIRYIYYETKPPYYMSLYCEKRLGIK